MQVLCPGGHLAAAVGAMGELGEETSRMPNDWIDISPDFPCGLRELIRARVFGIRADHALADDDLKIKLRPVSASQCDLWVTCPDGRPPTSRTIIADSSAPERVGRWLEAESSEWCSRTGLEARSPLSEVFEGGPSGR